MASEFIHLGKKIGDGAGVVVTSEAPRNQECFPCLYITSEKPLDLGDEGTAEIRYKRVSQTEETRDGETSYRYELEVHGINPLESREVEDKPKRENLGETISKLKKKRDEDDGADY